MKPSFEEHKIDPALLEEPSPDAAEASGLPDDLRDLVDRLTPEQREEVSTILENRENAIWTPQDGPQVRAYNSTADIIGYGGAAGGGKTDLAVGKALTQHNKTLILRRTYPQIRGVIDRFKEILTPLGIKGFNSNNSVWVLKEGEKIVEFGSVQREDDKENYQGRAHDLLVFDEATSFSQSQFEYLRGWVRTDNKNIKAQTLLTFNPPTTAEGKWVTRYFAPWILPKSKENPITAVDGELLHYAYVDGEELISRTPKEYISKAGYKIHTVSRTFISARLQDNKYLMQNNNYLAALQAMPEDLREKFLNGNFVDAYENVPYQLIRRDWLDASHRRWETIKNARRGYDENGQDLSYIGIDVSRGGRDKTVAMSINHEGFVEILFAAKGKDTPTSGEVGFLLRKYIASNPAVEVMVDAIGVGAAVVDHLRSLRVTTVPIAVNSKATKPSKIPVYQYSNLRTQLYCTLADALNPDYGATLALPNSAELREELLSFTIKYEDTDKIKVSTKQDIFEALGRSPDFASALILLMYKDWRDSDTSLSGGRRTKVKNLFRS